MQKIYFKKMVDLNHRLKELVSISVDESIRYKMESQGMRALGSIMINGEYKDSSTKQSFHDSIDLDIFALTEKITDKREFHVKVEDFDYALNEGNLSLVIQACIYGVLDDEDRIIETNEREVKEEKEDVVLEIENLLREDPIIEEKVDPVEKVEPIQDITVIEEDDEEDLGTYYLYVVQDGDTYQSIAARYKSDEYRLKDYNHDRPLSKGVIVIVPYLL